MSTDLIKKLDVAHAVGTPLVAVTTADPGATVDALVAGLEQLAGAPTVFIAWDCASGPKPLNEAAKQSLSSIDTARATALPGMLIAAQQLPENAVLFIYNAHRFLDNPIVSQALWNLRDVFKQDRRMVILLAPSLTLPRELVQDVVVFDEPMPTKEQIGLLVDDVTSAIKASAPAFTAGPGDRERAVEALTGMTAFAIEQTAFLSQNAAVTGYDHGTLWARKRKQVEQTRGLSFDESALTFEDIGGIERIKEVTAMEFNGPRPPKIILRVDEIDKMMAGTSGEGHHGDTSGTSDDAAGVLLKTIEDNGWQSKLLLGAPGTAKTMYSRAVGPTFGRQTLVLDLGACKGPHVGNSEEYIRDAMKTIFAIAGADVSLICTCNRLEALTPEMLRRLRRGGIWFFTLPTEKERDMIWKLQLRAHGLEDGPDNPRPNDTRYSGSDIRDACENAYRLRCPLVEAAVNVVTVAQTSPEMIERLESSADGRYLSASYRGVYKRASTTDNRRAARRIVAAGNTA